ncbi:MAG: hypothetical protein V4722_18410 [Bacteroidota bacterium]
MTKNNNSFWETQKENFKFKNKSEFISDSVLRVDYKTFKSIKHPLFDSTLRSEVYFYSWQDRDETKNEFTVINDEGELGLKIFYFILDKKDSLLSRTQVSGKGGEGGYWFETRTKLISKDTMLHIGSITQWLDFEKEKDLKIIKGDTTFSYLIIDRNGKVARKVYKEVKDLHFKNE